MAAYMENGVITQVGSGDFIRGYIREQQRVYPGGGRREVVGRGRGRGSASSSGGTHLGNLRDAHKIGTAFIYNERNFGVGSL